MTTRPITDLALGVGVILALCGFGDPGYSPVISNMTDEPLRITLRWANGPDQQGALPIGSKSFQRIGGRHLIGIRVTENGGRTREYDQNALDRLRKGAHSTFEVWVITRDALLLRGKESLRKRG